MLKKNLLIWGVGGKNWMGGISYIRNILFQLSLMKEHEQYNIYLCIDFDYLQEFDGLREKIDIFFIRQDNDYEQLLKLCDQYKIDIIFPLCYYAYAWMILERSIFWIPDFQEQHLPDNFTAKERKSRAINNNFIAKNHKALVLSSHDSYNDYKTQYADYTDNVFIVHFVSYIQNHLEKMHHDYEEEILKKFGINFEYIYIANQFWKHKNHIVVLKALNELINKKGMDIHLVCTGYMQSYDESENTYIRMLREYIADNSIENNVHFLGLVERDEQLCIMKNANLVIQPSLFEGWGCGVEDAKVLDKTMLLSDISVHREQKNKKTILFSPNDEIELSCKIFEHYYSVPKYDLQNGSKNTYQTALLYEKELERVLASFDKYQGESCLCIDRLEKLRENKITELFGDLDTKDIGIYGVGQHTGALVKSCKRYLKDVKFTFFDSDPEKWGKDYCQTPIRSPQELMNCGLKRIVISSSMYEEEIYDSLAQYRDSIEIVKIYDCGNESPKLLWA